VWDSDAAHSHAGSLLADTFPPTANTGGTMWIRYPHPELSQEAAWGVTSGGAMAQAPQPPQLGTGPRTPGLPSSIPSSPMHRERGFSAEANLSQVSVNPSDQCRSQDSFIPAEAQTPVY